MTKKTTWTPERLKKFKRTMAAKKKLRLKTKRSGVIPFSAIPDPPKPKLKTPKISSSHADKSAHTKSSSYEEKYTAKQVIALIKELMK